MSTLKTKIKAKQFVITAEIVPPLSAAGTKLLHEAGQLKGKVDAINIKRRAFYTDLAAKRGAKIEEVAATTACEIFATRVQPGQYYRLSDGVWRQREAGQPAQRPGYCG